MGDEPLMTKYISLYSIAGKKNVMVAHILRIEPLNISFWRAVVGERRFKWLELVRVSWR
jgi:hypothetical protein